MSASMPPPPGQSGQPAPLGLLAEREKLIRRPMIVYGGSGQIMIVESPSAPVRQEGLTPEGIAVARLTAENDQLRAERALYQAERELLLAKLAAQEAEIVELRSRSEFGPDEDEINYLPHRRSSRSIRGRGRMAAVRRGVPFIHPEYLEVADE